MCFPFGDEHEVDSLASDMGKLFQMNPSALEDDTLALQTDIQVKARARGQFWNLLDEEKDPNIKMGHLINCSFWLNLFMRAK